MSEETVVVEEFPDFVSVGQQGGSLRVTIPQDVVEELGLENGDRLRVLCGDGAVGFRRD